MRNWWPILVLFIVGVACFLYVQRAPQSSKGDGPALNKSVTLPGKTPVARHQHQATMTTSGQAVQAGASGKGGVSAALPAKPAIATVGANKKSWSSVSKTFYRAAGQTAQSSGSAGMENTGNDSEPGAIAAHVVTTGNGAQDLAPNAIGLFPRVTVQVHEKIPVSVTYAQAQPGDVVAIQMLDGGTLDNGTISKVAKLDDNKALHFVANISEQAGIHRVELLKGAERQHLEFWAGAEAPSRE